MDCEFPYQTLSKQWPVLELKVCSYRLNIGKDQWNIALTM